MNEEARGERISYADGTEFVYRGRDGANVQEAYLFVDGRQVAEVKGPMPWTDANASLRKQAGLTRH